MFGGAAAPSGVGGGVVGAAASGASAGRGSGEPFVSRGSGPSLEVSRRALAVVESVECGVEVLPAVDVGAFDDLLAVELAVVVGEEVLEEAEGRGLRCGWV